MKRVVIALMGLLCVIGSNAQERFNINLHGKVVKEYRYGDKKRLNVGDDINVKAIETIIASEPKYVLESDGTKRISGYKYDHQLNIITENEKIELSSRFDKCVEFNVSTTSELWNVAILTDVVPEVYLKKGAQEELRKEMENDAIEYISILTRNGLHYNDPAVYSYIYGLITKIVPAELLDGRLTNVNLLIANDPMPNAYVYPNGTLIVNIGLLSTIRTEAELVGVLCHEIAHYVLEHSVVNVNKALARKKRAEFWAAMATGLTAVAEGVAAANSNYIPGLATASVASLSAGIAEEVIDRLGMEFDEEQELEADEMACKAMNILGYSPDALATALYRVDKEARIQKYFNPFFPSDKERIIKKRIKACGTPLLDIGSGEFEIMMAMPITQTAITKCETGRFRAAIELADINISNGVAVTADLLVKANSILSLYDTQEKANEALALVEKAKTMSADHAGVLKSEILVYLRLKDYEKTMVSLTAYKDFLTRAVGTMKDMSNDVLWLSRMDYYNELEWIKSMQLRVKALQGKVSDL